MVLWISTTEAPLRLFEIETAETSVELNSAMGTAGKSNSIENPCWIAPFCIALEISSSGTFLAVRTPDSVWNSILSESTKPFAKRY